MAEEEPVAVRRIDPPAQTRITCLLLTLTAAAVQSGLLYGYDTGIVSGAMVIIRNQMELDDLWQEFIVSATLGTAAVSALLGGFFNDKFGRKAVILVCSLLFIAGSMTLAFAPNKEVLLVGRIILGFAVGASSGTVPSYLAECSPAHIRGRLLVTFQLSMTCGFFIAAIVAASLTYIHQPNLNWRIMLGLGGLPALVQLIAFSFMPESPRWLALKGREEEARRTMIRIYGGDETAKKHAESELTAIKKAHEEAKREKMEAGVVNQPAFFAMLRTPHLRKALVIGCSLQIFQQLCGVNTVNYYGATIIIMSGVQSDRLAIWLTSVTSGVKMLNVVLGVYLVERVGRRRLLLWSIVGVILTLLLLGTAFTVIAVQSPASTVAENSTFPNTDTTCQGLSCDPCSYRKECGFCYESAHPASTGACVHIGSRSRSAAYGRCANDPNATTTSPVKPVWNYGYCPAKMSWLAILGLVLYLFAFAIGYAPMPWAINAEIFPTWARSTGNAASTACNYGFNLLVALTFLTLARTITRQGAFFLYAGITLIALVWFYLVVPETKDKPMEEIEQLLKGPWFGKRRAVKDITERKEDEVTKC